MLNKSGFAILLLCGMLLLSAAGLRAQTGTKDTGSKKEEGDKKGDKKKVKRPESMKTGGWFQKASTSGMYQQPFEVVYDTLLNRLAVDVLPERMRPVAPGVHQLEEKKHLEMLRDPKLVAKNIVNKKITSNKDSDTSKDNEFYFSETQWARIQGLSGKTLPESLHKLKAGNLVYGFHPFWMGNAYLGYDFTLVSRIGYFSYAVNPATGYSRSPFKAHSWRSTSLHQKAHNGGCAVDLVVTLYGEDNTSLLIGPKGAGARKTLFRELITLLQMQYKSGDDSLRRGDGITLDFQGFRKSRKTRDELTAFVRELHRELQAAERGNQHFSLNMVLPVWDPYKVYNMEALRNEVDLFIVSGYDYALDARSGAGPVSMLVPDTTTNLYSLDHSINYYLDQGMPREKTVLALPWYGKEVRTQDEKPDSRTRMTFDYEGISIRPYGQLHSTYGSWANFLPDKTKNSITCSFRDYAGWTQVWTEDTTTLGLKYEYVRKKGIAGAGIWALGYENGHPYLWKQLLKQFGESINPPVTPDTGKVKPIEKPTIVDTIIAGNSMRLDYEKQVFAARDPNLRILMPDSEIPGPLPIIIPSKNYNPLIMICLLTLLVFALTGFIISLFYESIREVIFSREYFAYIILLVIVICLVLLQDLFFPEGGAKLNSIFIGGAIVGSIIIFILLKLFRRKENNGPTP